MGAGAAIKRLFGLACIITGALLGLFALFGFFSSEASGERTIAVVIGALALFAIVVGIRYFRPGTREKGSAGERRMSSTVSQGNVNSLSRDSQVLVVVDHPYEKEKGLRFHLYECAGVKSGRRSGCKVETMQLREAEADGRTICAFCAEGRTVDPFYEPSKGECDAVLAKWPEFAHLQFGDNPPTVRQFAYAVALGVKLKDGVSFKSISHLIEKAKANASRRNKGDRPSDEEVELIHHAIVERGPTLASMLKTIKQYHGLLPRDISADEARRLIEFLEDYYLPCPFCGIEVCAIDDECCACGKSLSRMRIPIEL